MRKNGYALLFFIFLFVLLFPTTSFADIKHYGEGNDNFHKDHFVITEDTNGEGSAGSTTSGIGKVDAYGYYNGLIDPENEDDNFVVKYQLSFSAEDKVRINKGDISVKVTMNVADTTSGSNDIAKFDLFANVNGVWTSIDHKYTETSGATWTFLKNIPVGTTVLELKFFSEDNLANDVEFTNVDVYFYDNVQPDVTEIVSSASGTKKIGDIVDIQVKFDEAVNVTGTPRIKLNTNGYASYYSGSGTNTLTFRYTVAEGHQINALNYSTSSAAIELNGGTIRDRGPNDAKLSFVNKTNNLLNRNIKIDGKKPVISSITAAASNNKLDSSNQPIKHLNGGDSATLTVNFDEPVNVTGTAGSIKLSLSNGSYAIAQSTGSNLTKLDFRYNVTNADNDTALLEVVSLVGGTIMDIAGNDLNRTVKSIAAAGISIDNTAPAASFSENLNSTYAKSQDTVVTITDSGSGLSGETYKYYWSSNSDINSVNWSTVTNSNPAADAKSVAFSGFTGNYYLHVRAEDVAGNIGYDTSGAFALDNQGPAVNFSPSGSSVPKGDYNVQVTVSDPLSGINASTIEYQWYKTAIDANNWRALIVSGGVADIGAVGNGVSNDIDDHGKWRLVIRGADSLGNGSTVESGDFLIDKLPPEISISTSKDMSLYNKNYDITITASDANGDYADGSISGRWYQWTDSETSPEPGDAGWMAYSSSLSQGAYNGVKWLHAKALDNSGNITVSGKAFKFDNEAPVITFVNNGSELVQKSVTANISLEDELSGVKDWYYQWTQGGIIDVNEWKSTASYSHPLSNADGDWYLSIKAVDNAGNESSGTSNRFRLDNMPPTGGIDIVEQSTNVNIVDINITAADTNYPDEIQYRISVDEGLTWSPWSTFAAKLDNVVIPDIEGTRSVQIQYRDKFNNESIIYQDTVVIDKTAPTAEVIYSITDTWVAEDVTAILGSIRDTYRDGDSIIEREPFEVGLVNSNGAIIYDGDNNKYTYTFANNGRLDFTIRDQAGNETVVSALVNWIDKTKPAAAFTPNGNTNASRSAAAEVNVADTVVFEGETLKTEAPDIFYYYWSKSTVSPAADYAGWSEGNNGELVQMYNADGEWYLHIKASDSLGNTIITRSSKFVLDNTPPNAEIEYSNTNRTANPVTAYITFDEPTTVTKPSNGNSFYTFEDNGSFTFEFKDKAGNTGSKSVSVDWIDKNLPKAYVSYSATDWTNENVTVTMEVYGEPRRELLDFSFPSDLDYSFVSSQRESDGTVVEAVYQLSENGSFSFVVRDLDTDVIDTVNVVVNNIDKIHPHGEITYSETQKTRDDIEVTILASDNTNQSVEVIPPSEAIIKEVNGNYVYVFSQNGNYDFVLRDVSGNEAVLTAAISNIDREPPTGTLVYTPGTWTKGAVTAVLEANEEIEVLNNGGSAEYVFFQNGSFSFNVRDIAGNTNEIVAQVDWIDKIPPSGMLIYNATGRTNKDVEIKVEAEDNSNAAVEIIHPEGLTMKEEEGITSYLAAANGSYIFKLVDAAGNEETLTASINNIDKILPLAEVNYSSTAPTNENVEIRLTLSETADIIAPEGILVKVSNGNTIYEAAGNGEYVFTIIDLAKNENTVTASINNIDRIPPVGSVSYSTLSSTRGPVVVEVSANEEFKVANNFNSAEKVFTENGSYTFVIEDRAGNRSEVKASVANIDNVPPAVTVTYSSTEYTNSNVFAYVTSNESIKILNNNGSSSFEFKENGTFKFKVADQLGNETTAYANVSNIDKVSPTIAFPSDNRLLLTMNEEYDLADFEAYDVIDGKRIDLTDAVQKDESMLDITKAGRYKVVYSVSDRAGNTTAVDRHVAVLSPYTFRTFINGLDPQLDSMVFDKAQLNIAVINSQGAVEVKWKKGYLNQGAMKSMANTVPRTSVKDNGEQSYIFNAPSTGYFTFYIMDQERNVEFIRVYVK